MSAGGTEELQKLREFLTIYNHLTELCFRTCISDFNNRSLVDAESSCLNRCIEKSMNVNRKIMNVFADIGPEMMRQQNAALQAGVKQPTEQ